MYIRFGPNIDWLDGDLDLNSAPDYSLEGGPSLNEVHKAIRGYYPELEDGTVTVSMAGPYVRHFLVLIFSMSKTLQESRGEGVFVVVFMHFLNMLHNFPKRDLLERMAQQVLIYLLCSKGVSADTVPTEYFIKFQTSTSCKT